MKTERQQADTHSVASAEDWFARLSADDVSAADRIAFEHWRNASPENDAAYQEVERLWRRSGALHRYPDIVRAMNEPAPARRVRRRRLPLAAAAALVAAVAVGVLQPWNMLPLGGERVATVTEQRNVMLADGSSVLLDADSELRVRYREDERDIVLEKGRAQFTVRHNPARPFVVKAGDGAVKALGTQFQVQVDGGAVTVTLLEGSVQVESKGKPSVPSLSTGGEHREASASRTTSNEQLTAVLSPGEQLRFDNRGEWDKKPVDVAAVRDWVYGDMVFEKWRLGDFVAEMNRYSDTKVRIEDSAIKGLLVSGRFHAGDQQSMVRMLETGWPVNARTVSQKEVILSRR